MKRCILAAGMALASLAACTEALEFPEWSLPVEADTRVIEYRHVPAEERDTTIERAEELVIGERGNTDARYAFTVPYSVTVDARGRVYVLDTGADGIKVFDGNGDYLRELGREGEGPGEFQDPRSVTAVGDRVIVGDSGNARWSHFDLEGNHVEDHAYPVADRLEIVRATSGGELVGSTLGFAEDETIVRRFGAYSSQGELLRALFELTLPSARTVMASLRPTGEPVAQVAVRGGMFGPVPWPSPLAAVGGDGTFYVTTGDEYQVLALDPQGAQRWALRVAAPVPTLTREEIDDVMAVVRDVYEDATESEVSFPDRQPALSRMLVDGHGHLYVFPYVWEGTGMAWGGVRTGPSASMSVPVDVYSADGGRLFSGTMTSGKWVHADGDHVWEIGTDPATREYVVRKVRLVEPFD